MARKRLEERQRIFGDCEAEVWNLGAKGFVSIPRILPLIMLLVNSGRSKSAGNPSKVYLDLWARAFDAGFLKIGDESASVYSAGYTGKRGARTWREHMKFLRAQGFIKVAESGNRPFAYVLLVNPYLVVARQLASRKIRDLAWINAFIERIGEIGAVLPVELSLELAKFRGVEVVGNVAPQRT